MIHSFYFWQQVDFVFPDLNFWIWLSQTRDLFYYFLIFYLCSTVDLVFLCFWFFSWSSLFYFYTDLGIRMWQLISFFPTMVFLGYSFRRSKSCLCDWLFFWLFDPFSDLFHNHCHFHHWVAALVWLLICVKSLRIMSC